MNNETKAKIMSLVDSNEILLFMKGNKEQPKCGFSAQVVDILNRLSVDYTTFDILSDEGMRAAVKEYSNWPTYPQLYFKGKLIGGCDIVTEMFKSGALEKLFSPNQE